MSILNRYIARQFLFNFVMLFVVITGLYILLDLIVNFDEFVQIAGAVEGAWWEKAWATAGKFAWFYWPRAFMLYSYMVGLLPVGAAGFTLAALVRNRELVAMLAGGVSMHRVAAPVIFLTFVANVAMVVNQEFVLPRLAHRLIEGHAKLRMEGAKKLKITFMPDSFGALFTAGSFEPESGTLEGVTVLRRVHAGGGVYGRAAVRIVADQATWDESRGGWTLTNGKMTRSELADEGRVEGFVAEREGEVSFIQSDLTPQTILLRERERYRQMLSLRQVSQLIDQPRVLGPELRDLLRIRHARFSMIAVNMLILLMGLPYFLMRTPGLLLLPAVRAAAVCVPAWAGGFVMHQISPQTLPPAAVAWLPVALYLPIAYYMMDGVET